MNLKSFVLLLSILLTSTFAMAQKDSLSIEEDPIFRLKFDARMDANANIYNDYYETEKFFGEGKDADYGFQAKYLMLVADGAINKHFSYKFRYRMKAGVNEGGGFDFGHTLDWANVTYSPNANWHITMGQQTIEFGGYEYDRNPMDVYFASRAWNTVRGFRPGIAGKYVSNNSKHYIIAQILQSDLSRDANDALLGYNILWAGSMGWFNTRYSLNFNEYARGEFMNKIYLGHKLNFNWYSLELDYANRYTMDQKKFFSDFSIIANNIFAVAPRWNIFVKGGYEQNLAHNSVKVDGKFIQDNDIAHGAPYLAPGSQSYFYGLGFEYYPLIDDNNNLRIHFAWSSNNGMEIDNVRQKPLSQTFTVGIRWNMKVVDRRP